MPSRLGPGPHSFPLAPINPSPLPPSNLHHSRSLSLSKYPPYPPTHTHTPSLNLSLWLSLKFQLFKPWQSKMWWCLRYQTVVLRWPLLWQQRCHTLLPVAVGPEAWRWRKSLWQHNLRCPVHASMDGWSRWRRPRQPMPKLRWHSPRRLSPLRNMQLIGWYEWWIAIYFCFGFHSFIIIYFYWWGWNWIWFVLLLFFLIFL